MQVSHFIFFFNDTATTEIYTLSLHDALPISQHEGVGHARHGRMCEAFAAAVAGRLHPHQASVEPVLDVALEDTVLDKGRSEEHTSELQSRQYLVCRLLLEKKKKHTCVFV